MIGIWTQTLPKLYASLTPGHGSGGWGSWKHDEEECYILLKKKNQGSLNMFTWNLRSPTGGLANGTPWNAATILPFLEVNSVPLKDPQVVFTVSSIHCANRTSKTSLITIVKESIYLL